MQKATPSARQENHRVAAIIPAFNEETYIGTVVLKTRQHVDETFVADDGSSDKTAEIAKLAGATVIRHRKNQGYGASIQSMLKEVRKKNFDIVVLLDADSQHDPDDIPAVIQPLLNGYDMVIGTRREQQENIPRYRRLGQKVIGLFSRVLSGTKVSDSESGFRAFSRKAIEVLDLRENGMAISAETISRASEKGLKIAETPISIRYTDDGSTKNPVIHGMEVLSRIIVMISQRRPLFFFGVSGMVLIVIGLASALRALNIVAGGGGAVSGYSLAALLALLVGSLSVFTGLILNTIMGRKS